MVVRRRRDRPPRNLMQRRVLPAEAPVGQRVEDVHLGNGVFDQAQEEVFKQVGANAVKNTIEGFNSTIFAYGQTGSGKTFTMTGGPTRYADRGLIPRSISTIFQEFRTRTDVQSKTYISYLEIYNERGYDLLDPSHETKALEDLPKVPTCLTS